MIKARFNSSSPKLSHNEEGGARGSPGDFGRRQLRFGLLGKDHARDSDLRVNQRLHHNFSSDPRLLGFYRCRASHIDHHSGFTFVLDIYRDVLRIYQF